MVKLSTAGRLFYETDFIFVTKLRQVWEREKGKEDESIKNRVLTSILKTLHSENE